MFTAKVYENNAGCIYAVVRKNEDLTNIVSGLEADDGVSVIKAAQEGFPYADDYDPDNYSGASMNEVAAELDSTAAWIATITSNSVELYEKDMGCAGKKLFKNVQEFQPAQTPIGQWWNAGASDIPLYRIGNEVFALDGWNGEMWTDCWVCSGEHYTEASERRYEVRPVYQFERADMDMDSIEENSPEWERANEIVDFLVF